MQIVTDSGLDLAQERMQGLDIHIVPLTITLGDTHYRDDIQPGEFYQLLRESEHFPTTSQPSPADFVEVYKQLAPNDPDIIAVHMSSKLSGTFNASRLGAERIMKQIDTNITVIDSHHIGGTLGFIVEAAARAAKAGWSREDTLALVQRVGEAAEVMFSPDTMKYLMHGGRVSHLRGFAATMLNIKPILKIRYAEGGIESVSTVRTMKKALNKQVDLIAGRHGEGTRLRVQIEHADNPDMAAHLRDKLSRRLDCHFLPDTSITPLIGAHTGPGLVGVAYIPESLFDDLP